MRTARLSLCSPGLRPKGVRRHLKLESLNSQKVESGEGGMEVQAETSDHFVCWNVRREIEGRGRDLRGAGLCLGF